MSLNDSQISYEEFNYWVGHISNLFDSLGNSTANLPAWSVEEVASIKNAFSLASRMTLAPAQYWSAFQEDGLPGVVAAFAVNSATSYAMETSAGWAMASASALGLSAGASFMVGLGAGLIVGAGISYGIDWATGGNLVGSIAGIVDYLNDHSQSQSGPTTLPDGTVLLPPLIVTPSQDFDALSQASDLIAELHAAVDMFNNNYSIFGIELDLNDLTSQTYSGWIADFESALEQTFGDPNVPVTDQEVGLGATLQIAQTIEKLAELYEDNPEAFDAVKPDFGENIQQAHARIAEFVAAVIERISPLVLDLNGDGIHTISMLDSGADFDFGDDATGPHGWLSPEDGFLALDRNDNGRIDDLSELFGSRDRDGFSILAAHDDNGDGIIDAMDAVFADLKLWMDSDSDGVSQAGEVISLTASGITAIGLDTRLQDIDDAGNWLPLSGAFTREDGTSGEIADVYFARLRNMPDQPMDVTSSSRVVLGGRHADLLAGSAEDQIFVGGRGGDVFVWGTGQGHDMIADFTAGGPEADIIDLTRTGIHDLEDLRRRMTEVGDDIAVILDDTTSLSLLNTRLADLSAASFMFA